MRNDLIQEACDNMAETLNAIDMEKASEEMKIIVMATAGIGIILQKQIALDKKLDQILNNTRKPSGLLDPG